MLLVDTDVLIDVHENDAVWADWSVRQLRAHFSPRSTRYASIGPGTMSYNEAETRFYLIDPVFRALWFLAIAISRHRRRSKT